MKDKDFNTEQLHIEDVLREHGFVVHAISGVSMLPLLRQGRDTVSVKYVAPEDSGKLKVGDVPLYRMPSGKLILHRIMAVKKDHYIIRGDNVRAFEKIPFSYILGVADGFYRDDVLISVTDEKYLKYSKSKMRLWRTKKAFYTSYFALRGVARRIIKGK